MTWMNRFGGVAFLARGMVAAAAVSAAGAGARALPPDFVETVLPFQWEQAVGLTFDATGRMYVWEKGGKVWIVENGVRLPAPLIDISEEVGNWRDYGLLGFAIDPDFANNGRFYLGYVVDYHHLINFGTPQYSAAADQYFHDTIARVTRYTATAASNRTLADPASRQVLVGESITTGIPICHQSHGIGALQFGADGTLLVSAGDGASYSDVDAGGPMQGSSNTALADGIINTKQDIGAFRAQLVDSLSGKILRIDPGTGNGVANNPFFDPGSPRAARSRVWAVGARNPFRFTIRPLTGHARCGAPEDECPCFSSDSRSGGAHPGVIYLGDVGWGRWEDISIIRGPGENLGWPFYEGLTRDPRYDLVQVPNLDAPNPLFGVGGCTQQYFTFHNLIIEDTLNPLSWPNPCNAGEQIPASIPRFKHTRPVFDFGHGGPSRQAIFIGNDAAVIRTDNPNAPIPYGEFEGNCSTGGVWYTGADFPAAYRNVYYHADFVRGWIRVFEFDAQDRPVNIRSFVPDFQGGSIVALATNPAAPGLYYIAYNDTGQSQIRRITYGAQVNNPPTAVASPAVSFGPAPLVVQFSSAGSSDPENLPLTYLWDFGDGTTSTQANPSKIYSQTAPPNRPRQYTVSLTVCDSVNQCDTELLLVSLNNTPPVVDITSPMAGMLYDPAATFMLPLAASISDAEHDAQELTCRWQTILHHDVHTHPEPAVFSCAASTQITPHGVSGETFFWQFILTVTDAHGLSTTVTRSIQPAPPATCPGDGNGDGAINLADITAALANWGRTVTPLTAGDASGDGEVGFSDITIVLRLWATICP